MSTLFLVCAVLGCTVLAAQFALMMFGIGMDVGGAELHDVGHVDASGHTAAHYGGFDADAGGGDIDSNNRHDLPDPGDLQVNHSSAASRVAEIITFQTVVAFLAFFGLGGLSSLQAGQSQTLSVILAVGAGLISMLILSYVYRGFRSLERDGTVRITRSVGANGKVYLRIPAEFGGDGKVTLSLLGRSMEVKARTPGKELSTGSPVRVTRVIDNQTVEVVGKA